MSHYESWGRYHKVKQSVHTVQWLNDRTVEFIRHSPVSVLPFGLGRSYGDSCLNDGGALLDIRPLKRFISFDTESGILRAEAGVTLSDILQSFAPQGWFLPVTPGTKFVTLGGAIANDVHGKNHHCAGTFGSHVLAFELLRSSGERIVCNADSNTELFRSTIGGLGLTGLILWVELKLRRIQNEFIDAEFVKFNNLDEFFELSANSDRTHMYSVSWVDCMQRGPQLGRGIFIRGNHAKLDNEKYPRRPRELILGVPLDFPNFALNRFTVRAFNQVYFNKQRVPTLRTLMHYNPFFYPLDHN